MGYERFSVVEQHRMITVEHDRHIQILVAAADMWRDARAWIDDKCTVLSTESNNLTDGWRDDAGLLFRQRVYRDIESMQSWYGPPPLVPFFFIKNGSIATSGVIDRINELIKAIQQTYADVNYYYDLYLKHPKKDDPDVEGIFRGAIGACLDDLVPKYVSARDAMRGSVGEPWSGPRDAVPEAGQGPGPGVGNTGGDPASAPDPLAPDAPPVSADQGTAPPGAESAAVDALGTAAQAARGLLSGGLGTPNPIGVDPASLNGLIDPAMSGEHAGVAPPGSPGMAGGGAEGGAAGAGTPRVTAGTGPPTASAPVTGAVTTAATGGSGGMPPPIFPPMAGGVRGAGGIRPGAADHPASTGRPRDRKPAATPGVALRGRTGGSGGTGATGPAPAARRAPAPRRARETNDVGLPPLDDELWRVDQPGDEPAYRAINLRRGT